MEILVFPVGPRPANDAVGASRTDPRGRFELSDLLPGSYLLALNKPGYQVLLAQVNTRLVSRMTLTLAPGAARTTAPSLPDRDSMDWVLRMPRTDVLKEWENGREAATEGPPDEPSGPGRVSSLPMNEAAGRAPARLPINGEVRQWFTSGFPFSDRGSDSAGSTGRTTAVDVSGSLGERGGWRVGGLTGSLVTGPGVPGADGVENDQDANRLRLAMRYEVGPEDSLRFLARYERDRFRGESLWAGPAPGDQEVRTWGYQADWSRRGDEGQALKMNLGFLHALGRNPDAAIGPDALEGAADDSFLQDRRWNAGAAYGFSPNPRHRVSVQARSRVYRYDQRDEGWILVPVQPSLSVAETGERGWSVSLSGEDSWKISDPLGLTLGLDYHRAGSVRRASTLVPRFGARREGKQTVVSAQILLRFDELSDTFSGRDFGAGSWTSDAGRELGYRAEVLHGIGTTWKVGGHAELNPIRLEADDPGWDSPIHPADSDVLLLVDPLAKTREIGIQVRKRFKGLQGSLESERGRIAGRVATRLESAPIRLLGEGEVEYLSLKATASLLKTDTEVRLDYHRLAGSDNSSPPEETSRASRVDLLLLQQLPRLGHRRSSDWRILFACQTLDRERAAVSSAAGPSLERIRRLSGGVGVTF